MTESEQNLDTDETAQEQEAQTQPPQETEEQKKKPFDPEQEQWLKSWLGRVEKGIKDSFSEFSETRPSQPSYVPSSEDPVNEFNKKLYDMVLDGQVVQAFQLYNQVQTRANENLTKTTRTQTDKALTAFQEEPYYKDVFKEAQKIAHDMAAKGIAPQVAAEAAFAKAEAGYLKNKNTTATPQTMLEGGIHKRSSKAPKLPDVFKKAFERDKKAGLFKTEAEYIERLSPQIREKYGI